MGISDALSKVVEKTQIAEVPFGIWAFFGFGFTFLLARHQFQLRALLDFYKLDELIVLSIILSAGAYVLITTFLLLISLIKYEADKPYQHAGSPPKRELPIIAIYSMLTAGLMALLYSTAVYGSFGFVLLLFSVISFVSGIALFFHFL